MTTITLNASDRSVRKAGDTSFVSSFWEFCAGIREGQEIETRYRKLSRMSPSDLSALGLARADIYRAALLGRPV